MAAETGIALAFAGAAWILYHSVLRLWWTYDDFYHLHHLVTGRPWWYLFDATEFHRLAGKVLTPLLFLSLDLDRRVFGLDPHAFYLHHLLVLSCCPAALYGVLRLWLPRLWSGVGAWIFLIGPVIASLVSLLMVRHYIEVILLAALAVAAWAKALQQAPGARAWRLAGLSAALYFTAAMAKESAVPLPLLLLLLPDPAGAPATKLAARMRLVLPHTLALAVYLAIRYAVHGTLLAGYGFTVTLANLPGLALTLPAKTGAELLAGRFSAAAAALAIALAAGILSLLVLKGRRAAVPLGFALLAALLPVLPVSTHMEPRYAVPAWIAVSVAFAAGCRALSAEGSRTGRRAAVALAAAACIAGLSLNLQDWSLRFARVQRMSAENRFLLATNAGNLLRQPLTLAASLWELRWMKESVFQRPRGGGWFQDDLYLCVHPEPLGRVWGYDAVADRVTDITTQIPAQRARYCSTIRPQAPLSATSHVSGGAIFWELGPYPEGKYSLILGDGTVALEMPRRAGFETRGLSVLPLRIKYVSPTGWITYSPELRFEVADGSNLDWSRRAGDPLDADGEARSLWTRNDRRGLPHSPLR
jgi:hypothetical protein